MQTVKFPCGKCNKVMAVGANLAGKQVRCPHCQQVIQAPAAAPALEPTVAYTPPGANDPHEVVFKVPTPQQRTEEEGSIFGEGEEEGDDLFNSSRPPTVEMPAAPPATPPKQAWPNSIAAAEAGATAGLAPASTNGTATEAPTSQEDPSSSALQRSRQMAFQQAQRSSNFSLMLLIVIVPYALIMTAAVIFLLINRPANRTNDFPKDLLDDGEGAIRKRANDMRPLPDDRKVGLGTTSRIGDLEVTPESVAWKRILFAEEGKSIDMEQIPTKALVITLNVKNVSEKDTFAPNDIYFNRQYKEGVSPTKPFTCLQVIEQDPAKEKRFYGGPCKYWAKTGANNLYRGKGPRWFIKGTEITKQLKPGEEMKMIVCTDPENADVARELATATDLMWRIQLRRGFIQIDDKVGTVTSVIGVPFKSADIKEES